MWRRRRCAIRRSGFIAYAPTGSIKRGEALATTGGNGKTMACGTCHGPDLKGVGPIPNLAGRSPSYLARQMYDIKLGTRNGAMAALMKPVVAEPDRQRHRRSHCVRLVAHAVAFRISELHERWVRFVVIGVAGANYYALGASTIFTTLDRDLFLPCGWPPA